MRTEPVRASFGAGFALLLATVGAAGGFAYGSASREPVEQALQAELARSAAERGRVEAELQSVRLAADQARHERDQARRDLVAAQAPAGALPGAGPREHDVQSAPALRRPTAPRLSRPSPASRP